ncbi:MAG: spermidine synthase, partial [Pseudomonadales bacterium]
DPAVVKVARNYFHYQPSDHTELVVQDARVFTKREIQRIAAGAPQYDLVMLDAFNGDYIPEHLLTREYLEETRAIMAPGGVLAANTFAISRLYDHESTTYESVFGAFLNYRLTQTGNRVILAINEQETAPLATAMQLEAAAVQLDPLLGPYEIELLPEIPDILSDPDWDSTARVLTDQYSPANILSSRRR